MDKKIYSAIKNKFCMVINLPPTTFRDWLLILLAVAFSWVVGAMIQGNLVAIIIAVALFFFMLFMVALIDRRRDENQKKILGDFQQQLATMIKEAVVEGIRRGIVEGIKEVRELEQRAKRNPQMKQ